MRPDNMPRPHAPEFGTSAMTDPKREKVDVSAEAVEREARRNVYGDAAPMLRELRRQLDERERQLTNTQHNYANMSLYPASHWQQHAERAESELAEMRRRVREAPVAEVFWNSDRDCNMLSIVDSTLPDHAALKHLGLAGQRVALVKVGEVLCC